MAHRLFIAIDLPEAVRRRLAGLVADAPRGVRPVRPEQIHLTLHFLGDIDDEGLATVTTALGGLRHRAFAIDLTGAGVFPPQGRPTVLWAGVAATDDLLGLHRDVTAILASSGMQPDPRPWAPHVTLARLGPLVPRAWTTAFLDGARHLGEQSMPVTAVRLYESSRTPTGTSHVPVVTIRLAAGDESPPGSAATN